MLRVTGLLYILELSKPCVSREVDSAILTRSQDFLSAEDDLIGSISDQPRGGPGIGDVVLKVCTLSSEKKYKGHQSGGL